MRSTDSLLRQATMWWQWQVPILQKDWSYVNVQLQCFFCSSVQQFRILLFSSSFFSIVWIFISWMACQSQRLQRASHICRPTLSYCEREETKAGERERAKKTNYNVDTHKGSLWKIPVITRDTESRKKWYTKEKWMECIHIVGVTRRKITSKQNWI